MSRFTEPGISVQGGRIVCSGCELSRIQGVICHETGCPEAWRSELRDCPNCGSEFIPESRWQRFCDDDCGQSYYG